MPTGEMRMAERKEMIQEAARELFLQNGYRATSMRAISDRSGVSLNTIYNYFGSKDELFRSLDIPEMKHARPDYDERKSRIVHEALLLFGSFGFEQVTMADIAEAMGMVKPTLYKYFSSKEELFVEALRSTKLASSVLRLQELPHGTSLREAMTLVGQGFLDLYQDSYRCALLKTIIASSAKFPEVEKHYFEVGVFRSHEVFAQCIRDAGYTEEQVEQARCSFTVFISSINMYIIHYRIMGGAGHPLDEQKFLQRSVDHICAFLENIGIDKI